MRNKLMAFLLVVFLLVCGCSKQSEKNHLTMVISEAQIAEVGFTSEITGQQPADNINTATVDETIYGFAKIDGFDVSSTISVTETTPDGTEVAASLPIISNGYVFAQMIPEQNGTYTISWLLSNGNEIEKQSQYTPNNLRKTVVEKSKCEKE